MRSLSLHTADGHVLAADEAPALGPVRGAVVLCHPHPTYGGNRFNIVVEALFGALPPAGFTTLRFDFRAAHDGGVAERLDVVAALDAVAGAGPRFVVGYSFGALVALATTDPRVRAVVAVAPPLTGADAPPVVPVLVLSPERDQFCPPGVAAAAMASWPDVIVDVIPGADHFLGGSTGTVADRTVAWLSSLADEASLELGGPSSR